MQPSRVRPLLVIAIALTSMFGEAAAQVSEEVPDADFLKPEACRDCHKTVYEGYVETSHYAAMREVTPGLLEKQFAPEDAIFYVKEDTAASAFYELAATPTGYEQRILLPGDEGVVEVARLSLDLELGSGKYAKAYLRWDGAGLFVNPLSYYTTQKRWAFGPGIYGLLPSMHGMRPATAACLDCHSGHFEIADPSEYEGPEGPLDRELHTADTFVIKKRNMVLPISCAKCHGPSAKHVRYHRENPEDRTAAQITRIGELPRTQQVQICGFCHTPPGTVKRTPFTFEPGQTYSDFIEPAVLDLENTDPHATQAPYLTASRCFEKTPTMTCTTCHNPHRRERGELEHFSRQCAECHETGQHCTEISMQDAAPASNVSNCIDCHMPLQQAAVLKIIGQKGESFPLYMRNHWIKVH